MAPSTTNSGSVADRYISPGGRIPGKSDPVNDLIVLGSFMAWQSEDEDAFRRIWPIIIAACDGHAITQSIIFGMHYLESHIDNGSLSEPRWRSRAIKIGAVGMSQGIAKARAFFDKGGPKVYAEGILGALNKGIRGEPLKMID
jgi:hypothetical protein